MLTSTRSGFLLTVVAAVLLSAVSGCGRKPAPVAASPPSAKTTPPSDAAAKEFAGRLQKAVLENNEPEFTRAVDWAFIIEHVLSEVDAPNEFKTGFRRGYLRQLQAGDKYFETIRKLRGNGSFDVLRVYRAGDETRAQFRLVSEQGEAVYYDFVLADRGGETRAVDLLNMNSGLRVSDALRQMIVTFAPPGGINFSRMLGPKLTERDAETMKQMGIAMQQGQPGEALRLYRSLPAEAREIRAFLIIRVECAAALGDKEEYRAALADYARLWPKDPTIEQLAIQYHLLTKNYDAALEAVDRLAPSVADDPYLDYMRASIHYSAERYVEARDLAMECSEANPHIVPPYFLAISCHAQLKDFDMVQSELRRMDEWQEFDWSYLKTEPAYEEFRATPQYAEFQAYLAARPPREPMPMPAEKEEAGEIKIPDGVEVPAGLKAALEAARQLPEKSP